MSKLPVVRFIDFDRGSLLVLTEDFNLEAGWTEVVRPDFSWWLLEDRGVVGFSVDGLLDRPPDLEFLGEQHFRMVTPQFRLFNAGVSDVAAAAYTCFVEDGHEPDVARQYRLASALTEAAGSVDDFVLAFQQWSLLYHALGHVDGLYWMGVTSIGMGAYADAIHWLEEFLDRNADHPWAHCHLGTAHLNLGNSDQARLHWEVAVCLDSRGGHDTGAAELLVGLERQK